MAAVVTGGAGWTRGAATGSKRLDALSGAPRPVVVTTLLTSLPVLWSALTTLTMRSAVPAADGEPATARVAAADARIKQRHRKMFPLSI
jgi:hypothetical protein